MRDSLSCWFDFDRLLRRRRGSDAEGDRDLCRFLLRDLCESEMMKYLLKSERERKVKQISNTEKK